MRIMFAFLILFIFCLLLPGCRSTGAAAETETWYLSSQTDRAIETISVPEELSKYAVKVPVHHTETVNNVVFTLDFFQEYYPLGSLIQLRITITNKTGADIEFIGNNSPGYFSDGQRHLYIIGITVGQAAYYAKQSVEMETIKTGDTVTYEQLYLASPDFFKPGKSISYVYDKLWDLYKIEFPIEVVKLS